jgi:hypothetical protein
VQHHAQTHGGDEDETHHEFPNDSVSSFPRCCASSALLQHREMIGERRETKESARTHAERKRSYFSLSLSSYLAIVSPLLVLSLLFASNDDDDDDDGSKL